MVHSMARRFGIFLLVLLAAAGLLAAGLLIWATSESGARFISSELRTQIRKDTGFDMSFGDVDLDIIPPRIRLNDIEAGDEKGRVKCTIEEAEFAPRPLDLIAGKISIEEVYLGSPSCAVRLGKREIDSLDELVRRRDPNAVRTGLDLSKLPDFDVFAVSSGKLQLTVQDEGRLGALDFTVDGFGLDVTGGEPGVEVRGLLEHAHANWRRDDEKVDESLEGFRFRAAVAEEAIDIRHLSALVAGANIRLRDAHIPLPMWPQGPDVTDLSVEIPLALANRLPLDLPHLAGTAGFLGQISIRQERDGKTGLSARGRVQLDDAEVDEIVVGDLNGLVSLTPRGVAFAETELKTAEGRLSLSGNIEFDEHLTADISAYLDGIELAHLLEQLTVDGAYVTQKMTGPIKLKGRLNPLRLDGSIRLEVVGHTVRLDSFRVKNAPIALHIPRGTVQGKVSITEQFIEGRELEVSTGSSRVDVDMRINFDDSMWRLHARSNNLHMEDIKQIAEFEVGGHGRVNCLITGLLWEPRIKGSADLEKFVFEGLHFDHAVTDVNFLDGVLSFDGLSVKRDRSRASVTELVLDFNAPGGLNVLTKIEAEHVAVEELARVFHIDTSPYGSPKGLLFGRVAIDYNLKPDHLRIDADLVHDEVELFGERFGPDVLKLTWDDGALTVTEFGLTKGRGTISVTGAMLADSSINFIGVASGLNLDTIDNPEIKQLGIRATAQAFVVAEGTLDHPQGWANVRLSEAVRGGVRYGPTTFDLALDDTLLTGKGRIAGEAANVEHLELDLSKDKFLVEGFVHDLDLVPLLEIDSRGHTASFDVTGEMAVSGSLSGPPNISGHANFDKVRIAIDDFEFANKHPLKLRAKRSRFRIKRARFGGPDIVFDVKGMFGLERMDIKIKGLADLNSASSLVDGLEKSAGRLNFEVKARGAYDAPSLHGSADLRDGMVSVSGFPHRIEQIRGQVSLNPKLIRFLDFTARCAEGGLGASGEIRLKEGEIADYQFRLQMSDLELALIEDLTFTASTVNDGLILSSPRKDGLPNVTGDVEVRNLRYTHDIRVLELSDIDVDRLSGKQVRASKPKLIDKKNDVFSFDVKLHGDRNLQGRNNLFDVDLVIDDLEKPLRLVGTNQTFGFLGRILGKQGQVRFLGKRFDIKYAAVDFRDPLRPDNPHFRVTADGQVRDWKVTMTVEGTVEEYELKFASQPYLPREDIVSVIMTGLTRAEHRQFGGSAIPIGDIFSQLGPGSGAIPLEFRVYSEYSEKAGTETTRIALGRWITPDVWVSVSSSVGQDRDVEAHFDYKINNQFSITAGYENDNEGNVGNVGLDLKFRLEF